VVELVLGRDDELVLLELDPPSFSVTGSGTTAGAAATTSGAAVVASPAAFGSFTFFLSSLIALMF